MGKKKLKKRREENSNVGLSERQKSNAGRFHLSDFIGITLLGGSIFNLPVILKKPETREDQMMLAVVGTLMIGGLILLSLPRIIRRKKDGNN